MVSTRNWREKVNFYFQHFNEKMNSCILQRLNLKITVWKLQNFYLRNLISRGKKDLNWVKFWNCRDFTWSRIVRINFLGSCNLAIGTIKFRQIHETSRQSHLTDIKRNLVVELLPPFEKVQARPRPKGQVPKMAQALGRLKGDRPNLALGHKNSAQTHP